MRASRGSAGWAATTPRSLGCTRPSQPRTAAARCLPVGPEPSAADGRVWLWRAGRNALWALTIIIVAWKCIQTGPYFFVEQYAPPPTFPK